ncbi:hypothetical protein [Aerosakkonema funiforme]|uniref:Uncharacterized protein n=1 Tax=Aerosakkonema funiforme FACHB-1375 TaxID=2949571 RepID=A0A926ZHT0_9CYAN|nr:hypothetical protein [Aerosakkonema funiforme]MBD2182512.1 hypothetical protein [Aerosakkonema funiforme FACHB-1375]
MYFGRNFKISGIASVKVAIATTLTGLIVCTNFDTAISQTAIQPQTPLPNMAENPDLPPNLNLHTRFDDISTKISENAQVHAIGVYEGYYDIPRRFREHKQGMVELKITKNDTPIVLVLTAYEPVKWNIINESNIKIEYVILSGYHNQEVTGITSNTPILNESYKKGDEDYFYFYKNDSEVRYFPSRDGCTEQKYPQESSYVRSTIKIKEITGLEFTSIQGKYSEKNFEINNQTQGSYLSTERDRGFCYKNSAGELERNF